MNLLAKTLLYSSAVLVAIAPASLRAQDAAIASSFGYNAEDATECLQKAIDSGAKKVVVDKQAGPWIVRPIALRGDLELVLQEGVEIVAKLGEYKGLSECLLTAKNAANITIRGEGKGATLRMRKHEYWSAPYDKSEWRHGVSLLSSENVTLENLTIAETGGDGIYLGVCVVEPKSKPCKNITIKNVDCVQNNRQGISVISVDGLLIEDCLLRDTVGTAPESGIDFEPNKPDEQITNVVMRRVKCINNAGDGIQFYLGNLRNRGFATSCLFENCESVRNCRAGFIYQTKNLGEESLPGSIVVKDSAFYGNHSEISLVAKCSLGAPCVFENVRVVTLDAAKALKFGKYADYDFNVATAEKIDGWKDVKCVYMASEGEDSVSNGGVEFKNVELTDASDKDFAALFLCRDGSAEAVGFENVSGNLTITRLDASGKTLSNEPVELTKEKFEEIFPASKLRRVKPFEFEKLNDPKFAKFSKQFAQAWAKNAKNNPGVLARQQAKYAFYLEKDQSASWTIRQRQVGRYAIDALKSKVTAPSGAVETLQDAPGDLDPHSFKYVAKETGWHVLDVRCGDSTMELTSDFPVLTSVRPSVNLCYSTGTCQFYVPEGAKDLGVRVTGSVPERVTFTVIDPDGTQVARYENVDSMTAWSAPLDENGAPIAPKTGFWTLKFEKPTVGVLEDYIVTILGVPALLK